jgi:CubicO group peptidase (beta-lactamase class C family)
MTRLMGDADLAATIGKSLGGRPGAWAAASVDGEIRVCASDAGLHDDFEIGSVSKGITGLLYAEAIRREEIRANTRLDELLPVADAPIAAIPLALLATHTSGLPRLAPGSGAVRATWDLWRNGTNPYHDDLAALLERCRHVKLKSKPRPAYSNFGFQLLGHALAAGADTTYATLVQERIADPLGLRATYVPASIDELRSGAVVGTNRSGRPTQPWVNEAIGPAGGVRSSISDLAIVTSALLDGSAPGMGALEPVRHFAGKAARIGAAWMVLATPQGEITWHNGGTGGFRTFLGINRDAGKGVVVVSATTRSVDRCGFDYLGSRFG